MGWTLLYYASSLGIYYVRTRVLHCLEPWVCPLMSVPRKVWMGLSVLLLS